MTSPDDDPSEANGEGSASDFYDASSPPFGELPEKPKRSPAPAEPEPVPGGPIGPREIKLAASAALAVLTLLVFRRRRRPRRGSAR